MATIQELSDALVKADAAGNVDDAKALANEIRRLQSQAAPSEGMPGARAPAWSKDYPGLYSAAVTARQTLGPALEAAGATVGGILGTGAGPVGTVAGAGLGYGAARQGLRAADVALGLEQPAPTVGQAALQAGKDVATGAGYEMGGALATRGVGAVRQGIGAVRSALSPEIQAGQIARATLANDPALIRQIQAANLAQPGALPSQAAAALPDQLPAYQALLRTGEQTALGEAAAARNATEASHINQLDKWAGGATKTEQMAAGEAGRKALTAVTTPMREQELAAAGEAGRVLPGLQATAERFGKAAESKVEDVRRFSAAADRALQWARDWAPGGVRQPGAPIPPTQFTYPGELAGRAEAVTSKAAEDSLLFGQVARDAQARMASLEAHGLRPLDSSALTSNIQSMLKDPEIRYNQPLSNGLARIQAMIQDAKQQFGQVTPETLYAIRKNGVNSVIEDLSKELDPAAKKKLAATMLSKINPMIDSAIEKAGGTGWKDYLDTYAKGREALDTQTLFGKLSEMYKNNKQAFVNVVEGNDPVLVRETLGGNKIDIKDALGDKYAKVRQMADYVKSEEKIATSAKAGAAPLTQIMAEQNKPMMNRLISLIGGPKVELTNQLIEGLRGNVAPKVMSRINAAAKSGQSMNDLLNTLPYNDRVEVMNAFEKTPGGAFTNALSKSAAISVGNALAR